MCKERYINLFTDFGFMNLNNFDEPPHQLIDEVMRTFFENANIKRFTKDEIYAYKESLKALRGYENVLE